jgi:hypothetical protein
LSLVLLAGAGLLVRSFARLIAVEAGVPNGSRADHEYQFAGTRYRDQRGVQLFAELGRRVRAQPGVVNASTVTFLPFKGGGSATYFWKAEKPKPAPGREPVVDVRMVQPR